MRFYPLVVFGGVDYQQQKGLDSQIIIPLAGDLKARKPDDDCMYTITFEGERLSAQ